MREIEVKGEIEVILGKGKYGYQKVLDDFKVAKKIMIITYNISVRGAQELIGYLKNVDSECEITIITNIPGRFENYYKYYYKKKARENISKYIKILNPEDYKSKILVYYNIANHSKFISTENIAYMGSQNFSDESKENFESGILFTNKDTIKRLWSEYRAGLIKESLNYHNNNVDKELLKLISQSSYLLNIKDLIHEEFYIWHDDYPHIGEMREYFCKSAATGLITDEDIDIWKNMLEEISNTINKVLWYMEENLEELCNKKKISENKYSEEFDLLEEKTLDLASKISILIEMVDEVFYEYVEFEVEEYMWERFDGKENINLLENYQKIGAELKEDLIEDKDIKKFEEELIKLMDDIKIYIDEVSIKNKKYLNIDNTK